MRKFYSYQVTRWRTEHLDTCDICDDKISYRLNYWVGFYHKTINLCHNHAKDWERGELDL